MGLLVFIVVSKHSPRAVYYSLADNRQTGVGHTIWVVTWLRHQDCAVGAPLQLFAIGVLLLECCERVEVLERRGAWDVLEVAVLDDTERHRADTLTRETERSDGILQAGSLDLQAAICPIYYSQQTLSTVHGGS